MASDPTPPRLLLLDAEPALVDLVRERVEPLGILLEAGRSADRATLRKLVRHDLRSPIAVILGLCELLALEIRGPLDDRQKEAVADIERHANRLLELLGKLADSLGEG